MKKYLGVVLLAFAGLVFLACTGSARAETGTSAYFSGTMRKLGRGIANIVTSPLEIPRTGSVVGRESGVIAQMTAGITQGVGRMLLRAVAGVFEIVTFPLEIPRGFEPLMKPEYVWADSNWQ